MRKRTPKIITFFFVALFFFSLVFSFALAQDRELEIKYPEIFGLKPETVKTLLPEYAKYIFNFSIAIFGLVVFGVLIKGGALYMTSAGNPAKMQDAKEQIFPAFLGLVILLSSYLILTTINPQLVVFNLPFLAPVEKKEREPLKLEGKEVTLISIEIPLGQMIENGIWKKEEIEKTKKLLDEFENFLKEETTANPTFNRISDLNKYLTTLTEDCRCDALTPLCGKPENWGGKVGCTGDPCKDVRKEIEKILGTKNKKGINEEKMEQLLEFKEKITVRYASSTEEAEKFLNTYKTTQECLERGDLLPLGEYLARAQFYDKQGWKTIIIPSYIPSRGDHLTFYCSTGGTILDTFGTSPLNLFDIPEGQTPTGMSAEREVEEFEPLSCPAIISVGEMLDEVVSEALDSNENLNLLTEYIDELTKEIRNMANLISKCNDQNCDIACGGLRNPCYMKVCGCIPVCPGDPPYPNPCWPNPFGFTPTCLIPKLQEAGVCFGKNMDAPFHGYPCPRDDIQETLEKIKLYDDEIFEIIKETKTSFSHEPYVLDTSEGSANLLNAARAITNTCFSETTEDEEPTWMMLNCAMALGNLGPDGNIIADCHPNSFFCCTADKKAAAKAEKTLPGETQYLISLYLQIYQPQAQIPGSHKSYKGIDAVFGLAYCPRNKPKGWCSCTCAARSQIATIEFMGKKISVHQKAKTAFEAVAKDLADDTVAKAYFKKWSSGGDYCCRHNVNASGKMSLHSYGIAIDINPGANPNYRRKGAKTCKTNIPTAVINAFTKNHFNWGGNFRSVCDAMHFEWMGWK